LYKKDQRKLEKSKRNESSKKNIKKHPLLVSRHFRNASPDFGLYSPKRIEKHIPNIFLDKLRPIKSE